MRRWLVSELDENARSLALEWGVGLETIAFCAPDSLQDAVFLKKKQDEFAGIGNLSLHAPYYEIFPSAIDPMIRGVAIHRLGQAARVCERLGIKRMIAHSGCTPNIYYPQWFVPKSIAFWREFAQGLPVDFELMIENVLDDDPAWIREIVDGVDDARVRICLDVGHVNAYSQVPVEEWIAELGGRIKHVHLHNNDGSRDAHASLDQGSLDMEAVLRALDRWSPQADICIESLEAEPCLRTLCERGYINDQSL